MDICEVLDLFETAFPPRRDIRRKPEYIQAFNEWTERHGYDTLLGWDDRLTPTK